MLVSVGGAEGRQTGKDTGSDDTGCCAIVGVSVVLPKENDGIGFEFYHVENGWEFVGYPPKI